MSAEANFASWHFLLGERAWSWALKQYDNGHAEALAEILQSEVEIPTYARLRLAQIIDGSDQRDLRGKHRKKILPIDEEWARKATGSIRRERDKLLRNSVQLEVIAEKVGTDVEKVVSRIHKAYRQELAKIAAQCGVSTRRLEDLFKPSKRAGRAR